MREGVDKLWRVQSQNHSRTVMMAVVVKVRVLACMVIGWEPTGNGECDRSLRNSQCFP